MLFVNNRLVAAALGAALSMAGCSSGGGGSDDVATSTVFGQITAFGSVFVEGVEYQTDDATVIVEGHPATEDDLAVGMLVTLRGHADGDAGVALRIEYSDELEGIVQQNDVDAEGSGTLTVMGLLVQADMETIFESEVAGIDVLADVPVNSIVEVSGHTSGSDGEILAARIELKHESFVAGVHEIEVKGEISNLDFDTDGAMVFNIATLPVNYDAAILDDVPYDTLQNGMYVEVKSVQGFDDAGRLIASKVELEDEHGKGLHFGDDDEFKLKGKVTTVTLDTVTGGVVSFAVNGQTILIDSGTELEHGMLANLVVGTIVKVKGRINDADELVAEKIKFKKAKGDIRIEANVQEPVSTVDGVNGTLMVLGRTVTVNALTLMRDKQHDDGPMNARYFKLGDIKEGDRVDVRAYLEDGMLVAVRLEREKHDHDDVKISGPLSVAEGTTVAGVAVDLVSYFPGFVPVDGLIVKIKGMFVDGVVIAMELEVKDRGEVSAVALNDFTLNDLTYIIDNDTEFEHGDASALVAGALVEVEANVLSDGTLIAEEVEFEEREGTIEIEACLGPGAVTTSDGVTGTLVLLGSTIQVTALARIEDEIGTLGDLVDTDDCVKVKAFVDGEGNLVATKIESKDHLNAVKVEGPVAVADDDTASIGGIVLDLTNFLGFVPTQGLRLEVKGNYVGTGLLVSEIEIDND
jgi:hypothetical protein